MDLWQADPDAFRDAMSAAGLRRAWLITEPGTGRLRASHPLLEPLAAALTEDQRDYRRHQGAFFEIGPRSGHLLSAFVHQTVRGQAAGGVRFWQYPSMDAFVRDGLRLSRSMGYKCALAGLWWGGGKGVIARRPDADPQDRGVRDQIYQDYGAFVSSLRGCYVTAEDAGTGPLDMAAVHQTTRHTTCIPPAFGGSGNPSMLTARGVVVAMEAALEWLGEGDLQGKTVATQGLGHVARYMIDELLDRGVKRIVGCDVDEAAVSQVREQCAGAPVTVRHVGPDDTSILREACDVLAPNAIGATLDPETIPRVRARVICGGANNPLAEVPRDAQALAARGVLYVPDFLANRMGIVNCANEQYGWLHDDRSILDHLDRDAPTGIFQRSVEIYERARAAHTTPAEEAEALAEELSEEPHPIWGNRGQQIIDALVAEGWESLARSA